MNFFISSPDFIEHNEIEAYEIYSNEPLQFYFGNTDQLEITSHKEIMKEYHNYKEHPKYIKAIESLHLMKATGLQLKVGMNMLQEAFEML